MRNCLEIKQNIKSGNGSHIIITETVENEALSIKIGVNRRNEVSKCNNHQDIKQNKTSGNGRHVRIPEIVENEALTMKIGVNIKMKYLSAIITEI